MVRIQRRATSVSPFAIRASGRPISLYSQAAGAFDGVRMRHARAKGIPVTLDVVRFVVGSPDKLKARNGSSGKTPLPEAMETDPIARMGKAKRRNAQKIMGILIFTGY
jgi:hypothetical protein